LRGDTTLRLRDFLHSKLSGAITMIPKGRSSIDLTTAMARWPNFTMFVAVAMGVCLAALLFAAISLESVARTPLLIGSKLSRILPLGTAHYDDENVWWPWPSVERNAIRVPDHEFSAIAWGILDLGQCVSIPHAGLILPGTVLTTIAAIIIATLAAKVTHPPNEVSTRRIKPLDVMLSTALALPLAKCMHLVWQGIFETVVYTDADRWRLENPGQILVREGYPVAMGNFGTSGIFLGVVLLQAAWLSRQNPIDTASPLATRSMRRARFGFLLAGIVFISWPMVIGWIARFVPLEISLKYIPF
jgi:hypothetical protein